MTIAAANSSPRFQVTQFEENSGIMFTDLFRFRLVYNHWNLVAAVPVTNLFVQLKSARNLFKDYLNLVKQTHPDTMMSHQLVDLEKELDSLDRQARTVRLLFASNETIKLDRAKRALFNSFGSAIKAITGNLDHEDALYFEHKLKLIESGSRNVFDITREQTSLVETTIHMLNGTMENWEVNRKKIQDAMLELTNKTNSLDKRADQLENTIELVKIIQETYPVLSGWIRTLREGLHTIVQAYEDIKINKLNPLLVTPDFLQVALHKLTLPVGMSLPLDLNNKNIIRYYDLIELAAFVTEDCLNLVIKVPLVNGERYTMHEATPVPMLANDTANTYLFVNPEHEYIGVSNNDLHYLPYTKEQAAACLTIHVGEKICPIDGVLKDIHAATESCVMHLYKNPSELGENKCDMRLTAVTHAIWTKATQPRTWMFLLPKTEKGVITCREGAEKFDKPENLYLSGRGLLSLQGGCQYGSESVSLIAKGEFQSKDFLPVFPPNYSIRLPPSVFDVITRARHENLNLTLNLRSMKTNVYDLVRSGHKISEIKNMLDAAAATQWQTLSRRHNSMTFSTIIMLVLMGLSYALRKPISTLCGAACKRMFNRPAGAGTAAETLYRPVRAFYDVTTGTASFAVQGEREEPETSSEDTSATPSTLPAGRVTRSQMVKKKRDLC